MAYNNFFANPPANSSNVNPNAGGLFALGQNTTTTQNNNTTTTPSLFGNTNPAPNPLQPQPTQPSLFGNTNTNATTNTNTNANTNTNTNTGPSLFGQQQPQQSSTGGSIFGNTNNSTSTGTNLFGGALAPSQNTTQNTTTTTTPSLFGNTNPASNSAQPQSTQPSLFGNTNTTTTTSTNTGPSLFGQQPQQPATGGSIFGNTNNSTSTGTSLFGGASAPTQAGVANSFGGPNPVSVSTSTTSGGTGGGLFGTNTNTNNANTNTGGGGLFGVNANTNTNTSSQQQQGTTTGNPLFGGSTNQGSLFSNTAAKPPGSGFFNVNTSNNNTNTGANANANSNPLFSGPVLGQPQQGQQSQQQQPLSNIFSSTTSNSLFSGNKTPTGNSFGGSTLGTSTLGGGQQGGGFSNTLLNSRPNTLTSTTGVGTGITGQQQLAEAQEQFIKITQGVETVYNAWHPASKDCRFQHIFYNLVDPKQVNMYGRPSNATNDVIWERAVRENPDPTCLVPIIAIGFDDLRERANAHSAQSSSHLQKLTDLSSRLKSLLTEHSVSNSSRLQRAHNTQTQLTQRLMRLVQHLHLLIPAVRSSSIRVEEEQLRGRLEEMEEELRRSRVKGKLNEMWALLGAVGAFMERGRGDGQGGQGEWAVVDEEGLAQITQILAEQQAGLQHLTKILQKDQKDLAIIMGKAGGDDGQLANEGENMWNSTNPSLRSR